MADDTSPAPSPTIKKPARTYGRPREPQATAPTFTPFIAPESTEPRSKLFGNTDEGDSETSIKEKEDNSGGFKWAWQKKLEEIDDSDVEEDTPLDASTSSNTLVDTSSSLPSPSSPAATHVRGRKRVSLVASDSESETDTRKDTLAKSLSKRSPSPSGLFIADDELPDLKAIMSASNRRPSFNNDMPNTTNGPGEDSEEADTRSATRKSSKKVKRKSKVPTKKELNETKMASARLGASRTLQIGSTASSQFTMENFLGSVNKKKKPESPESPEVPPQTQPSDPIDAFSSPSRSSFNGVHFVSTRPPDTNALDYDFEAAASDDELQAPSKFMGAAKDSENITDRRKYLQELKKQIVAKKIPTKAVDDDDDDLLVVNGDTPAQGVIKREADARAFGTRPGNTIGKKLQLQQGGIRPQPRPGQAKRNALPAVNNRVDLNRHLLSRQREFDDAIIRKKEEEWERHGGARRPKSEEKPKTIDIHDTLAAVAERGSVAQSSAQGEAGFQIDSDDGEDSEDGEWKPDEESGSASPVPDARLDSEDEVDPDQTMVDDGVTTEDEDDIQKPQSRPRGPRRAQRVIDSDDEDDSARRKRDPSLGNILVPDTSIALIDEDEDSAMAPPPPRQSSEIHGSLSTPEDGTEDETDKENDTKLMYDRSENKENKAVVHQPAAPLQAPRPTLGARLSSTHVIERKMSTTLSMSPYPDDVPTDGENIEPGPSDHGERLTGDRIPFQSLEDDPLSSTLSTLSSGSALSRLGSANSFAMRLQQASPPAGDENQPMSPAPSLALPPIIGEGGSSSAFSQFDEENTVPLKLGFLDFGEPTQLADRRPTQVSDGLSKLRSNNRTSLTQDVTLKPSLGVSEDFLRKAGDIFEKDQALLAEEHQLENKPKQQWFVNDHGFLTQTNRGVDDEVFSQAMTEASPSQGPGTPSIDLPMSTPASSRRRPLRTLSFSQPQPVTLDEVSPVSESPSGGGLNRLRRGLPKSFEDGGYRSSPSPSPGPSKSSQSNAFDFLRAEKKDKPRRKELNRSELVHDEAQESDEDEMRGFGGLKKDEDEEDGDHLDQNLETLVDDKEMDDATVNAEKVAEKAREHAEADDQELEKLHQKAVAGELRKKRRSGVGFDDSDEEDSDEESRNRRIRNGMKRPRLDRPDIKNLGENEETRPFAAVYQRGITDDDDDDMSWLNRSHTIEDFDMKGIQEEEEKEEETRSDEEGEVGGDEGSSHITTSELLKAVREKALAKKSGEELEESFDPYDVSNFEVQDSDGEEHVKVNVVSSKSTRPKASNPFDPEVQTSFKAGREYKISASETKWAAKEGVNARRAGAGRAVGAAVTGHRAKVKNGGGSLRGLDSMAAVEAAKRPVKAQPSFLSGVGRKDAFETR